MLVTSSGISDSFEMLVTDFYFEKSLKATIIKSPTLLSPFSNHEKPSFQLLKSLERL